MRIFNEVSHQFRRRRGSITVRGEKKRTKISRRRCNLAAYYSLDGVWSCIRPRVGVELGDRDGVRLGDVKGRAHFWEHDWPSLTK